MQHYGEERQRQLLSAGMVDRFGLGMGRTIGGLLMAFAVLGWIALLTWSPAREVMHGQMRPATSWVGGSFARFSEALLNHLGIAAVLFWLPIAVHGQRWFRFGRSQLSAVKAAALLVGTVMVAGGLSAMPPLIGWPLRYGSGGLVGDALVTLTANVVPVSTSDAGSIVLAAFGSTAGALCLLMALAASGRGSRSNESPLRRGSTYSTPGAHELGRGSDHGGGTGPGRRATEPAGAGWPTEPVLTLPRETAATSAPRLVEAQPADASTGSFRDTDAGPSRAHAHPEPAVSRPLPDWVDTSVTDGDGDVSRGGSMTPGQLAERLHKRSSPTVDGAATGRRSGLLERGVGAVRKGLMEISSTTRKAATLATPGKAAYKAPALELLGYSSSPTDGLEFKQPWLAELGHSLCRALAMFEIEARVGHAAQGPVVTTFEVVLGNGVQIERVVNLADDIARTLSIHPIRIFELEASLTKGNVVGFELPHIRPSTIALREILENEPYRTAGGTLPLALGKSAAGVAHVQDLARLPHLAVLGGAGTSTRSAIDLMVLSLAYALPPAACRLLTFAAGDAAAPIAARFDRLPHVLQPAITMPAAMTEALTWLAYEIDARRQRLGWLGVRSLEEYNAKARAAQAEDRPLSRQIRTGFDPETGKDLVELQTLPALVLPHIVVVIDDLAAVADRAGGDLALLRQCSSAGAHVAGVHVVAAVEGDHLESMQELLRGFGSRLCLRLANKRESRAVLGRRGGEQLLGKADALWVSGNRLPVRVHLATVDPAECAAVVAATDRQNASLDTRGGCLVPFRQASGGAHRIGPATTG